MGDVAFALIVMVPVTVPPVGLVMLTVGGGLVIVIVTAAEVVLCPRLSVAIARNACGPEATVVVSSGIVNVGPLPNTSAPKFTPSSRN